MNPFHALLLGIVEGLTEFLPVSSTGHLLLVSRALGIPKDQADTFSIVIQAGAILAVLVQYRALIGRHTRGLLRGEPTSRRLWLALVLAFLPTAVFALLLRKTIKQHLFGMTPIAIALCVGGVVMIGVDRWQRRHETRDDVERITLRDALVVGFSQVAALWPGTSRSLATLVGGQLSGLSARTAADFSFLLGLPTLGAACVYEAYKERAVLLDCGLASLAIGLVTSFVVAYLVIGAFLRYLGRGKLWPFGLYRIGLGLAVMALTL